MILLNSFKIIWWMNIIVGIMDQTLSSILGQWPMSYGPAILLHILKTFWWRNVVLGIMDQCDSKIDLVYASVIYILWSIDFVLYHCRRLKLLLYIKKWRRSGYSGPLWAYLQNWSTKLESSSKCLYYRLVKDSINLESFLSYYPDLCFCT